MHVEPPWVNKLLFPPAIKDQRKEPPMTDHLAALVRRVAELRRVTVPKNFIFGGFAPSVAGKLWLLNPSDWPILVAILFPVTFFIFSFIAECHLYPDLTCSSFIL
jgi:hypothetical protein